MNKKLLILAIFAVLATVGVVALRSVNQAKPVVSIPTPNFSEVKPGLKLTSILAPNGKMTLNVKEEKAKDGTVESFSIGDREIYKEALSDGAQITVPYNTFSPDNKYIFLKKESGGGVSYFVLKTDGTAFSDGETAIDFLSLFNAKHPEHKVTDVTGWGGMNLIVLNTDKDGAQSHSFWFEVPSKAIIQLTNRFN